MLQESQFPSEKERAARARIIHIMQEQPLVVGSLVQMARTCGKQGCHCADSPKHRHVSLYLALRDKGKRRMVCIPKELEQQVTLWVDAYKEMSRLMDTLSQGSLKRITAAKK